MPNIGNLFSSILSTPLPAATTTIIVATIPILIITLGSIMRAKDFILMGNPFQLFGKHEEIYDFIVVGGGSAGAAVAARLSETFPKTLLLEAGGDPHPLTYIPSLSAFLVKQPEIDWSFQTVRLNNSGYGLIDQKMTWPAGRSLGGSSNTNFMIYNRGNPEDFNNWARHTGDSRWAFPSVEKLFDRLEDYHGHYKDVGYHTPGGPMYIEPTMIEPSIEYWLEAAKEMGFPILDPNQYQTQLFSPVDVHQKQGVRFSTFRGYIKPAEQRKLKVYRYALVTKIHFDDHKRAYGLSYRRHGKERFVRAAKEIIICGGGINSAKLLMLSGIGPKHDLSSVGIPTIVDLPVGHNLQDHVTTVVGPFLFNQPVSFLASRDVTVNSVLEYIKRGDGPFSSANGLAGQGYVSTSNTDSNWPNILYILTGAGIHPTLGEEFESLFGVRPGILQQFFGYNVGNDSNVVGITLSRPKSRGWVALKDANPYSPPLINPNYFSDNRNEDLHALIEGIQRIVELYETTGAYRQLGARLAPNPLPGCETFELKSYQYWECYIRTLTLTIFHSSGTCSMGRPEDPSSVVDPQLRVLGVAGLRVCDASVMPVITNSNTNTPVIMIGEMCADLIKEQWLHFPH